MRASARAACAQGDILKNFNVKDGLADFARICIAITAMASFPMQHFPSRAALHNSYLRFMAGRAGGAGGSSRVPTILAEEELSHSLTDEPAQAASIPCNFLLVEELLKRVDKFEANPRPAAATYVPAPWNMNAGHTATAATS